MQRTPFQHLARHTLTVAGIALLAGCTPDRPNADVSSPEPGPAGTASDATAAEHAQSTSAHTTGQQPEAAGDASGATSQATNAATKPFKLTPEPAATAVETECLLPGLNLPTGTKVYAAGAYSGARMDFQIDQSGHQATTIQVAVNEPQAPVALLLGAYEPTVWSVGWAPGTRIVAVVVTGYHRQRITGLPADTPLLVSSHEDRGPCTHAYVGSEGTERLNPLSRQVFGRTVDMAYPARDGRVLVGSSLGSTSLQTAANAVAADSFKLQDTPLAGQAGIDAALSAGILRATTATDVAAWQAAKRRVEEADDTPPVYGARQPTRAEVPYRSYTVLRAFAIPAGLYGAHSATFYVLPGVEQPTGNPGHSAVFDIASGSCSGPTCRIHRP